MACCKKIRGAGFVVAVIYLSYLSYLLVQVVNNKPLIETSYEYLDKLDIPNIEICGDWSDIEVSKCVFTQSDGITTFDGCNEFLSRKHAYDNTYCYLYTTNDTYFFGNEEKNPEMPSVRNIDFYFKIKDIPAVTSHFLSVGTVTIQITDPKYSVVPTDLRVKQELQLTNGFAGIQNMSTVVTFKKTTLRTISPYDIFAILGMKPNYRSTPYLTSVSKNFPMHSDESFTDTGHFSIAPGSFINKVKSEKLPHTILGTIGSASCAFVVIFGTIMLFGRSRNNSWCMAKLEETSHADLQNLTFVSAQDEKGSTEQRMKQLEDRIQELEKILKNQNERK